MPCTRSTKNLHHFTIPNSNENLLLFLRLCHSNPDGLPIATTRYGTSRFTTCHQHQSFVKTAAVEQDSLLATIKSMGVIVSKTEGKPAFKTGGVVDRTYFKEGDFVRQGQLLATLLKTEIDAQVRQAEEVVIKSERDLQRVSNLHADSVATLEQVQNASTALQVAQQNQTIAQFNQQYSEARSPTSGKIVQQLLHEGEIAGPGQPVYVILGVANQDWRVKTGLIDRDWSQIKRGDLAVINLDAYPGEMYEAIVSDKAVVAGDASGTLDIELIFKKQPPSLAAGMICKVQMAPGAAKMQTTIPIEALVNTNGLQATVFVIDLQGKAKIIPIIITRVLGARVIVEPGLEGIDQVVTIGAVYLEEGDQIVVAEH
ncbi:MAG: efflux RND transporter periplasmic adaptor subunit [Saprospiraceae bacterium]|nr:efflux RND transporter periplasmic adaptor subunit [Saprospiraceae bacterium]